MKPWICRRAQLDEVDAIEALQVRSAMALGREFYTEEELSSYIREIGTLDRSLVVDGTFYVVEHGQDLVGCGGWGLRAPLYANATSSNMGAESLPRIQGFFVDPHRARQGIGSALMTCLEQDIERAGHDSVALVAMLSGVAFYRSLSYRKIGNGWVKLTNGAVLPSIEMIKDLDRGEPQQRAHC